MRRRRLPVSKELRFYRKKNNFETKSLKLVGTYPTVRSVLFSCAMWGCSSCPEVRAPPTRKAAPGTRSNRRRTTPESNQQVRIRCPTRNVPMIVDCKSFSLQGALFSSNNIYMTHHDAYSHFTIRTRAVAASTALKRGEKQFVVDKLVRTNLFNVITIRSPRAFPQYRANCSPP